MQKQLDTLKGIFEKEFNCKPVWDAFEQTYILVNSMGKSVKITEPDRKKLYGWFGNTNNKGKKWGPSRWGKYYKKFKEE